MYKKVPRIMIAGTNSGCGKTTVTCALLKALANRKTDIRAFKCGPDYIDPMFHSRITGVKCRNLDPFFFDDDTMRFLLAENAGSINVIEGVMGYYDGLGLNKPEASSYNIADITETPVILVVGTKGASLSVLALIEGFLNFCPDSRICGVILNQCTSMTYSMLKKAIGNRFGEKIKPLGFFPVMKDCMIESRHLGLVTAEEIQDLNEKLDVLAAKAEETLDIDEIIDLAENSVDISFREPEITCFTDKIRIAVARDRAFCFYYEDSLELLEKMGAEFVPFSPISDKELPPDIHGLYIGGGYPELYLKELSGNISMLDSVRKALAGNMPCIAECGGFMYLSSSIDGYSMAGYVDGNCRNTGKLVRFGYVTMEAAKDNMLCRKGESIRGHEFHYWDITDPGEDFRITKPSGKSWMEIKADRYFYGGFPHFNFYANPVFAENFYRACAVYKSEKKRCFRKTEKDKL